MEPVDKNLQLDTDELELQIEQIQIEQIIEKNEGSWRCKVCGKTTATKQQIQAHSETHIEGVKHICHICSKVVSTRNSLRIHIYKIHSELFSCNPCERSGMNRGAYNKHNLAHHKNKLI